MDTRAQPINIPVMLERTVYTPFTGYFLGRVLRESCTRGTKRIALDAPHPSGCPGGRPAYG